MSRPSAAPVPMRDAAGHSDSAAWSASCDAVAWQRAAAAVSKRVPDGKTICWRSAGASVTRAGGGAPVTRTL